MRGKIPFTRPNRKVTEFFAKKPKTGPAPDQPVYYISSSSSDRSIISVSSEDMASKNVSSQPDGITGQSTRVASQQAVNSRQPGGSRSTAVYVSSSSQVSRTSSPIDVTLSSYSGPSTTRGTTRPDTSQVVSNLSSKPRASTTSTSKNNAKKRKQPPIHVISSDSSDDAVFPVIRVKPSSRDSTPSAQGSRSLSHLSIDAVIAAPLPLSPRQNTLTPSNRPLDKPDTAVLSPSQSKKLERSHRPSPPKRARHGSFSTSEKICHSTPGDADDEGDDEDVIDAPAWDSVKMVQNVKCSPDIGNIDDEMSTAFPPLLISLNDADNESGGRVLGLNGQSASKTRPREDSLDVLPSSQQDEMELGMDDGVVAAEDVTATEDAVVTEDAMAMDATDNLQRLAPDSPSKLRVEGLIEQIKAKAEAEAEAEAAAQILLERDRSIGFGGDSDLSSLPSSSDDDDDELDLDLNTYGKPDGSKVARITSTYSPPTVSLDVDGIRRSTRNQNAAAPNYAKKLELFRDDISQLSKDKQKANENGKKNRQSNGPSYCPLDALLRDHERENARRARAEKKRKGDPSSLRSPSPVASSRHSGIFETPRRHGQRGYTESPENDVSSGNRNEDDMLVGDAEREELLGKEDAAAIGKLLAGDRVKTRHAKNENGIAFWSDIQGASEDTVPQLTMNDASSPVLQYLHDKLQREDYGAASLFINSSVLCAVSPTVQPIEWLFSTAMSNSDPALSLAAYRALLVSQREYAMKAAKPQLDATSLLVALLKFGVREQVSALLGASVSEKIIVVKANRDTKVSTMYRFVNMLEALGRSGGVKTEAIQPVMMSLLLLALDPLAVPELQQDVVRALESLLESPLVTPALELDICKYIVQATTSLAFTAQQEAQLLALIGGCGPRSGRIRRWTAWAFLGGDLGIVQECAEVPPLDLFADLFSGNTAARVRIEVNRDTDYDTLGATVEVLSAALTDVDAYIHQERSGQRKSSISIEGICKALDTINGKIADPRGAHLDRTRTKDAINRLHKRVFYQHRAANERSRGNAGTMDAFVTKSPSKKSKPKPKPVLAGAGHQDDR